MRARAATLLTAGALLLGLLPASAAAGSPSSGTTDRPRDPGGPAVMLPGGREAAGEGPGGGDRSDPGRREAASPAAAADEALAEAEALFTESAGRARRTRSGAETHPADETGDATMVLRELRMRYRDLSAAEQDRARALLLRPTDGENDPGETGYPAAAPVDSHCSAHVCYHWVSSPRYGDAPDLTDDTGPGGASNDVPDWVDGTARTFERVWATTVDTMGYRAPMADDRPTAAEDPEMAETDRPKLDVYLTNLAKYADAPYGYCTVDDPEDPRVVLPTYCVIDDDFAVAEYGGTPLDSLRATAAHEFFHGVQFAYDSFEDAWMMESTATWVEDEVFDGVDDNRQYLASSPLTLTHVPVDTYGGTFHYGSWIFWRFLSEHLAAGPVVVRDTWERAATGKRAATYSLQAIRRMLDARGRSFPQVFREFATTTRYAKAFYEEGRTRGYVNAPAYTIRLTATRRQTDVLEGRVGHLAHRHVAFKPGDTLRGTWRLRVWLDLPALVRGASATAVVTSKAGSRKRYAVRLDDRGDGVVTVPFSRRSVAAVTLTLTNASTRMDCPGPEDPVTVYSCGGRPLDDGTRYVFAARAIR